MTFLLASIFIAIRFIHTTAIPLVESLPSTAFNASSEWSGCSAHRCPFSDTSCGWAALTENGADWLEIDLGDEYVINIVGTKGSPAVNEWTETYQLRYARSDKQFIIYGTLTGNNDTDTEQQNTLLPSANIVAQYVTLYPLTWNIWPTMRVEIYGSEYVTQNPTSLPTQNPSTTPTLNPSSVTTSSLIHTPTQAQINIPTSTIISSTTITIDTTESLDINRNTSDNRGDNIAAAVIMVTFLIVLMFVVALIVIWKRMQQQRGSLAKTYVDNLELQMSSTSTENNKSIEGQVQVTTEEIYHRETETMLFIIVSNGGLYKDKQMKKEIFTVNIKDDETLIGYYIDYTYQIVFLTKYKVYISSLDVREVGDET